MLSAVTDTVTALVAGGDHMRRFGVVDALARSDRVEVVGETTWGPDALTKTQLLRPDVVLLDLRPPAEDGTDILGRLARMAHALVLAQGAEPVAVDWALRGGATSYLVYGQFVAADLATAVLATAQGQPQVSPLALRALIHAMRGSRNGRPAVWASVGLSTREIEIMEHIVRGDANVEIARRLFISEKTVKNHVTHIFAKLHSNTRAQAIARWLGVDQGR